MCTIVTEALMQLSRTSRMAMYKNIARFRFFLYHFIFDPLKHGDLLSANITKGSLRSSAVC